MLLSDVLFRDYLVSEARDKKQMDYDVSDWTLSTPRVSVCSYLY